MILITTQRCCRACSKDPATIQSAYLQNPHKVLHRDVALTYRFTETRRKYVPASTATSSCLFSTTHTLLSAGTMVPLCENFLKGNNALPLGSEAWELPALPAGLSRINIHELEAATILKFRITTVRGRKKDMSERSTF